MAEISNSRQRLTIRVGRGTLSFSMATGQGDDVVYEPFVVKSGVSLAANLREAFKTADLLQQPPKRVLVSIDSDVLMVPLEQFDEGAMEEIYRYAFPRSEQEAVFYNVLPDINAVAVFAMNKDLRMVVDDHFQDVRVMAAMSPVWRYLHQRNFTGTRSKLYGYFHEKRLEVFCYNKNRFKFCNSFEACRESGLSDISGRAKDSLFFLLYVWKQLQMNQQGDEMYLVGDIPEGEWMLGELKRYVQNVFVINPATDFGNHPVTEQRNMPYDLMTLYVKGR